MQKLHLRSFKNWYRTANMFVMNWNDPFLNIAIVFSRALQPCSYTAGSRIFEVIECHRREAPQRKNSERMKRWSTACSAPFKLKSGPGPQDYLCFGDTFSILPEGKHDTNIIMIYNIDDYHLGCQYVALCCNATWQECCPLDFGWMYQGICCMLLRAVVASPAVLICKLVKLTGYRKLVC
jgi:hypothetical protein